MLQAIYTHKLKTTRNYLRIVQLYIKDIFLTLINIMLFAFLSKAYTEENFESWLTSYKDYAFSMVFQKIL